MSHGHCYLWDPSLVRLHVGSDLAIGLAYVAISLTLAYLVWRAQGEIPFSWIFVAFGVFIIACGTTHFMEIWTVWTPVYWFSAAIKVVTAAASVATAIILPPLVPRSLALIRSAKLSERRKAELEANQEEIRRLNAELEGRVRARTAELAEANQRLALMAAIVEQSSDAIVSLNPDGCLESWNPAAERMYGYRMEEVRGRSVSILALASRAKEIPQRMARLKRGERIDPLETTHVCKTGGLIEVYVTLSLIKDSAGETLGASLIARNITTHKRSAEMFQLAVEAAPNAMIMVDGEGKIVLVNAETERLFGYLRDELMGREMEILVPPQYRDKHPERRAGFLLAPQARAMGKGRELYGLRKDGREFPVEIGLNPIRTEHGTWVLGAIVDITERKRADQEIKRLNQDLEQRVMERTRELSAANDELEAFSYSVSHDLRAPLRQIAGFSRILEEEYGPELKPEASSYLQRVQSGANHMGTLIDDLLNLARIGRRSVLRGPVALNPLIEAALEMLSEECLGRRIEWRIEELGSAECDSGLVKQVFINLLANALKYTRGRDCARIQVGQMTLDSERVIFIRDNGAGFDMKYAGKLFGVFQRLHTAQEFEGTGVGLATVQRILHKHGGRIWAEAEPGQGATFFFTLPGSSVSIPGAPGEGRLEP